jgi:hypothetical protein
LKILPQPEIRLFGTRGICRQGFTFWLSEPLKEFQQKNLLSFKTKVMKKPLIFLSVIFVVISLKSQIVEDWTAPVALTDSLSFNSKPLLFWPYGYGSDDLYMIYEKRFSQTGNGQIWWKLISDPSSEEQLLIGGYPEYNYRNPQLFLYGFLIFECNIYGNYDLFGVKIDENGTVGNIFQLTNTETDESSFYAPQYYTNICCWEMDGNIYTSEVQIILDTLNFPIIETIDTGNCQNPVCQDGYIAWRKIENNESHLYYSVKEYPWYQWSDPDTIIQTGNNINMSLSRTSIDFGPGYNICWEASDKIYFTNIFGAPYQISSPEIPGVDNYFEPSGFNLIILSDNSSELYSFAGQTGSSRDIYIVDEFVSGYILNITQDSLIHKNPKLLAGREDFPYYEVFNIWQTEFNGFDVLYGSSAWYLAIGGFNETKTSQIRIFPNPVSDKLIIHISDPDLITSEISILNNHGQQMDEIKMEGNNSNEISLTWKKGDLPAGVYFLVVASTNRITTKKFIIP